MSLQIHRAERADRLTAALGELLREPLEDPFASEIVSVPTPGVERWLAQRLSAHLGTSPGRGDGVCAGVDFPSPRRLVARALAGSSQLDGRAVDDPWAADRAVWPLLRVMDRCRGESWARPLWAYLGDRRRGAPEDPVRGGRRWSTARHLAQLFASYAATRAAMLQRWAQGLDVDATGTPLPPDLAWQAELWRRLRAELGVASRPDLVRLAAAELRADPDRSDLPARLSLFGVTRLDPDHLAVLAALAEHRSVHLWLPHPSPALWDQVRAALAQPGASLGAGSPRSTDPTQRLAEHRLLAYLGRDTRELQVVLAGAGPAVDRHYPAPATEPHTLLARLQADLAANRCPAAREQRPLLDPADRSVGFHACHGPDRQVEVLRELLVGMLADDPTLQPRDIVVMCPDIETFAPLIAAAFGLDTDEAEAEHPGHRLRVRLADRALRQLNPLLAIVHRLVALADSRMPASAVLDLCGTPPVARKFGFGPDDVERLQDLVHRAGVRWGLDAAHRTRFGLGDFGQNTWAAGLDRLLLGVTLDETDAHFIGTALPLDDVDSADVDLLGRFAECLARIRTITDACRERRPVTGWFELFRRALDLLTAVPSGETWQLAHAYAELGGIAGAAADCEVELALPEISALLGEAFRGRASRANFRTGTLTMCTLLPMRSVPHRVVCLLGVDDQVFPRQRRTDGDDLTRRQEWVGDPDPRSEDRQLLLDAILAASERLLVIYSGMDPRSGADIPPAVPIGELADTLELTARTTDGTPVRKALTTRHRLQPFDTDNFVPGRLAVAADVPFSFDPSALRGVRASQRERREPAAALPSGRLAEVPATRVVELADLVRFYAHPVRALMRERAGLSQWREQEQPDEQIPAALTGLDRWQVGERMLRAHLQGQDLATLQAAEWRRGTVPPRGIGQRALAGIVEDVTDLADAAQPFRVGDPQRAEVVADLGPTRLTGLVPGLHGDVLLKVSYSRLAARHRLQAWLELLAVTISCPERRWRAVTIGRGGRSVLGPVDPGWGALVLADLVDLQRTGLAEPLPFGPRTSLEYARIRREDRSLDMGWPLLDRLWSEERDEAYERFFGPEISLATLLAVPSVPGEERGTLAEPSRFGTLARRVYHPLLSAEDEP